MPDLAPRFTGRVDEQGMLRASDRDAWLAHVATFAGKPVEFWIKERQETRSVRANAYLWGVVYKAISDDTGQEPEAIHEAMKQRFLTQTDVVLINAKTGEMEEHRVVGSSSKLKVHDFYQFVENVRLFAAEWLGLRIPEPNEYEDAA